MDGGQLRAGADRRTRARRPLPRGRVGREPVARALVLAPVDVGRTAGLRSAQGHQPDQQRHQQRRHREAVV